jgi:tricorn protease
MPILPANGQWKQYRGGGTTPVWIADMATAAIEKIPRDNSNDADPMWVADTVFFLSDRDGRTTLYAYDLASKRVTKRIENRGLDIKAAQSGPGAIVYEQFGQVRLYDLAGGVDRQVPIRLEGELTMALPQWVNVGPRLGSAAVSPTGVRAVFEGRGEVISVPAKKGDARNLTRTPGVMERNPIWSPDGQTVAYFTEVSGQYQLALQAQDGLSAARMIDLGGGDNFYYSPAWSPDGKYIGYSDSRGQIWCLEVATGRRVLVDHDPFGWNSNGFPLSWSRDSRWIAYARSIHNLLPAVFIFDRTSGTSRRVTDGLSAASLPVFDASGRYLFLVASTDAGPSNDFSMSTFDRPVTSSLYAVVLRKDLPSPLSPESDDEAAKPDSSAPKPASDSTVTIDFDAIDQRTIAMPVPPRNYVAMKPGKSGTLVLAALPNIPVTQLSDEPPVTPHPLHPLGAEGHRTDERGRRFDVSRDGSKLLTAKGSSWAITALEAPIKPGDSALATASILVKTDLAEWAQMYREDSGCSGHSSTTRASTDSTWTRRVFTCTRPASAAAQSPTSSRESMGISVGHHRTVAGGRDKRRAVRRLLGADHRIANGRWQFARVLGENWRQRRGPHAARRGVVDAGSICSR